MIFDSNENGRVSVDETMAFLHARYGRGELDIRLKSLFGQDMTETGGEVGTAPSTPAHTHGTHTVSTVNTHGTHGTQLTHTTHTG